MKARIQFTVLLELPGRHAVLQVSTRVSQAELDEFARGYAASKGIANPSIATTSLEPEPGAEACDLVVIEHRRS